MKRIFLSFAAMIIAAGILSAQDINEATDAYNNGAVALQMGDAASALENFQNALSMAENLGDEATDLVENCKNGICSAQMSLAKAIYNSKKFEEAIEAFKQAKTVAETYGNADIAAEADELVATCQMNIYNAAGNAAKRSKDYATAIENFTKVLEMDPTNGAAAFNLGDSYYRTKQFAQAETYLLVAKDNGQEKNALPRLASIALINAKAAIKDKKFQEGYDLALASVEYAPTSGAYEAAGDAAKSLGNKTEALGLFEKAIDGAKPQAVNQIKYKIALTAQETGDKAKAIEYYNMILSDPNFAEYAKYQINELSK